MSNLTEVIEKTRKEREYIDYIKEHVSNVRKAFEELLSMDNSTIKELFTNDAELVNNVESRINIHDASKYQKEEFDAYRRNFHPINDEEKKNAKEDFDKAWNHHWKNNDHHWQNRENTNILNKPACIEMICDWTAMGYKFDDRPYQYYKKNKNEIKLNDLEKDYVESILDAMEKYDKENS